MSKDASATLRLRAELLLRALLSTGAVMKIGPDCASSGAAPALGDMFEQRFSSGIDCFKLPVCHRRRLFEASKSQVSKHVFFSVYVRLDGQG